VNAKALAAARVREVREIDRTMRTPPGRGYERREREAAPTNKRMLRSVPDHPADEPHVAPEPVPDEAKGPKILSKGNLTDWIALHRGSCGAVGAAMLAAIEGSDG
jgi:hypothetical protein